MDSQQGGRTEFTGREPSHDERQDIAAWGAAAEFCFKYSGGTRLSDAGGQAPTGRFHNSSLQDQRNHWGPAGEKNPDQCKPHARPSEGPTNSWDVASRGRVPYPDAVDTTRDLCVNE